MLALQNVQDIFAADVEAQLWDRKRFLSVILDFPVVTKDGLRLLFTGTYQLGQAISYLRELIPEYGDESGLQLFKEPFIFPRTGSESGSQVPPL